MSGHIEGFEAPLHRSLTEPLLLGGAPRSIAIMNGTGPGARDIAAFEHDLRTHAVAVLIYNRQTGAALAARMRAVAAKAGVPVAEVTETEPAGMTYQQWMLSQLDALDRALTTAEHRK